MLRFAMPGLSVVSQIGEEVNKRTFDDDYGRHALVYRRGVDGPAFGRVDVIQLGIVGDPVNMPVGYAPKHARHAK